MKINEVLKKLKLKAKKIEKKNNVVIVSTDNGKYVIKKSHVDEKVLNYLKSRNFEYLPDLILNNDYKMTKYVEDYNLSMEQKVVSFIKLITLLHSKTTYYSVVNVQENERIYNFLNDNINNLYAYYTDLISGIESKVFMSPSDLIIADNITRLYNSLDYNKIKLEKWHSLVSNKTRERRVVIHNNLRLDHFIRNEKSYLINWDNSRFDSPVIDLYKLFNNHFLDFNFFELLKDYEKSYPLMEDERLLLELLILIPENIDITGNEYEKCLKVNKIVNRINSLPEAFEKTKKQESK